MAEQLPEEHPQRQRVWSGAWRSVLLPVLAIGIIVGILWYFETRPGGQAQTGTDLAYGVVPLPPEKNATGQPPRPEPGRAAPDFILQTPDGRSVRLSDLQGKAVIINFWATWCVPCRKEFPEFIQAYQEFKGQGLEILAVDLQESRELAASFAKEFGAPFPIPLDTTGQVAAAYRITGLPVTFFIDRQGVVSSSWLGQISRELLRERLGKIL